MLSQKNHYGHKTLEPMKFYTENRAIEEMSWDEEKSLDKIIVFK